MNNDDLDRISNKRITNPHRRQEFDSMIGFMLSPTGGKIVCKQQQERLLIRLGGFSQRHVAQILKDVAKHHYDRLGHYSHLFFAGVSDCYTRPESDILWTTITAKLLPLVYNVMSYYEGRRVLDAITFSPKEVFPNPLLPVTTDHFELQLTTLPDITDEEYKQKIEQYIEFAPLAQPIDLDPERLYPPGGDWSMQIAQTEATTKNKFDLLVGQPLPPQQQQPLHIPTDLMAGRGKREIIESIKKLKGPIQEAGVVLHNKASKEFVECVRQQMEEMAKAPPADHLVIDHLIPVEKLHGSMNVFRNCVVAPETLGSKPEEPEVCKCDIMAAGCTCGVMERERAKKQQPS